MECVKDFRLELKEGQASNKGIISKMAKKIMKHKVITTIVLASITFMVLDLMLIASFVSILGKI